MRATFPFFDPEQCDHGPATGAILRIFHEWASVDWFEPPSTDSGVEIAVELLREHHARARSYQPASFSESFEVRTSIGDWSQFSSLCESSRVAADGWDWKFKGLKPLAAQHLAAKGWSRQANARRFQWKDGPRPRTGDLIVGYGGIPLWNAYPTLDPRAALPPDRASWAEWYLGFANGDFVDCVEWQLAENHDRLESNPFFPLVRCYGVGAYPFSQNSTLYVLHAFARDA